MKTFLKTKTTSNEAKTKIINIGLILKSTIALNLGNNIKNIFKTERNDDNIIKIIKA